MKVEIYSDLCGRFHWTLFDGPVTDEMYECTGSADSYDEACKQVSLARADIAQQEAEYADY